MKVLVTGATGFLGSWLTRRLVQSDLDVRVLCRPTSDLADLEGLRYEKALGDVTDFESLKRAAAGVDTVFHLAGVIAYTKSERAQMNRVNIDGTEHAVRACIENGVRRLVHMSSVVAVGASLDGKVPLNENSQFNLSHWNLGYCETKKRGEEIVVEATRTRGLDAVILNPATVYGGGDAKKGSRKTQLKVAQGRFPFYTPGGVNIVAVDDVVEATIKAWQIGKSGERYILGGENVTIKKLFELIAQAAGVAAPRWYLPKPVLTSLGKFGDLLEARGKKISFNSEAARMAVMYHWFDSAKAQRELALKVTPAEVSIGNSVGWMKEQGLLGI
ncbi:MAG: NAD-dependent epimerase/dehydratase family protein [Bdellovibrionia bacterium]